MISFYSPNIEQEMKNFFKTLSEKDRRHYVALETQKLPHGGITYLSKLLGCSRELIHKGIRDLHSQKPLLIGRIRKSGGGRKKLTETQPRLEDTVLQILASHTAGSPQDEKVKWTFLTLKEIIEQVEKCLGIRVHRTVIKALLKKHNYRKRKALKKKSLKQTENRNEQFETISQFKEEYQQKGDPIISIDTKKRIHRRPLSRRETIHKRSNRGVGS